MSTNRSETSDCEFLVTAAGPSASQPRPIIAVDGRVPGADCTYDHHVGGEPVNLDAIPRAPVAPRTIATPMLDGDAIVSAAVLLARVAGSHDALDVVWPVLYEAAHYCDHLVPSGRYGEADEEAGLGLHCWLKEAGFTMGEALAWSRGELATANGQGAPRAMPSDTTRSRVFETLSLAVLAGIRRGGLPRDTAYLQRLETMASAAHAAIEHRDTDVTVLRPQGYVDPLAFYRFIDTDLCVLVAEPSPGRYTYTLGVHPRAYGRIDLRPILAHLDRIEPGWGGRSNAGGSPRESGSGLTPTRLLEAVRAARAEADTQPSGG